MLKLFNKDSISIRGSHFIHTAKRELYMNSLLTDIFSRYGIRAANQSLGFWIYDPHFDRDLRETKQIQIQNSLPRIPKVCCLFETIGDRRALTHLIQGANLMLKILIHRTAPQIDLREAREFYAAHDRLEKDSEIFTPTPIQFEEQLLQESDFDQYPSLSDFLRSENFRPKTDDLFTIFPQSGDSQSPSNLHLFSPKISTLNEQNTESSHEIGVKNT